MASIIQNTKVGYYAYNNGWSDLITDDSLGHPCMGIVSAGNYRFLVFQIKTANAVGVVSGRSLEITLQLFYDYATIPIKYVVTTTAPSSSITTFPTDGVISGTYEASVAAGTYSTVAFTTETGNIASNTTYYIWMTTEQWFPVYAGQFSWWDSYLNYIPVEKFEWTNEKYSGGSFNLTADEWNELKEKIYIVTGISIATAVKGEPFTADIFNEAADAVGLSTRVSKNDDIYASYLNDLRDCFNAKLI